MQQTNKYELNKPDLDDPVAIAPLNENMDKLEAALIAEAKSRADADAAEISARTAAVQAEASARASAVTAEINARNAAIQAEASARASAVTTEATNRANGDKAEANARTAAIQTEANTRASADTTEANARIAADNALSTRIHALEAKRIVYGSINMPETTQTTVTLGFTPYAVLLHCTANGNGYVTLAVTGQPGRLMEIVANGFKFNSGLAHAGLSGVYTYLAFG